MSLILIQGLIVIFVISICQKLKVTYTKDRLAHINAKSFDNAMNGKEAKSDVKP